MKSDDQRVKSFIYPKCDGGLKLGVAPYHVKENQSPDMLNVWLKNGEYHKRFGQENVTVSGDLPSGKTFSVIEFNDYLIAHIGEHLYKLTLSDVMSSTKIYSSVGAFKSSFFKMNGKLYFINNLKYLCFDGVRFTTVTPYVPTVFESCTPDLTKGIKVDDYNVLTDEFKVSFHGDASSTFYILPVKNIANNPVKITVSGSSLTENNHFTVNRVNGMITFHSPPEIGINNVVITLFKTHEINEIQLLSCSLAEMVTRKNGESVALSGGAINNLVFLSAANNPAHFKLCEVLYAGYCDEAVTGFGVLYDHLIIFKSQSVYMAQYKSDIFVVTPISITIGCDMPNTIGYIDNHLVWGFSKTGMMMLVSTMIKDEKNIICISDSINGNRNSRGLLAEKNLCDAVSTEFDGKYFVCINSNVYVMDYSLGYRINDAESFCWYYFNNIFASRFFIAKNRLYYFSNQSFGVVRFIDRYVDFEKGIEAFLLTPIHDFDKPHERKTITDLYLSLCGKEYSKLHLCYVTDFGEFIEQNSPIAACFSFENFRWNTFSFGVYKFTSEVHRKPKCKKVRRFGVQISNDEAGSDLAVFNIRADYILNGLVK